METYGWTARNGTCLAFGVRCFSSSHAGCVGVDGWRVNRANEPRRAVAAIRRAGGGVDDDHKGRPWSPARLRKRLGDEFFQEVTSVQFLERSNVTDHDLAPLESLDRLEELAIHGAPITDSGLKHIRTLRSFASYRSGRPAEYPTPASFTWPADEAANFEPLPLPNHRRRVGPPPPDDRPRYTHARPDQGHRTGLITPLRDVQAQDAFHADELHWADIHRPSDEPSRAIRL